MFSVIIPTFNNLNYFKLCLKSLKENSKYNHEIIVHVNEGIDGTLDLVKNEQLKFSYSKIDIDHTFPKYIIDNKEKFKEWII